MRCNSDPAPSPEVGDVRPAAFAFAAPRILYPPTGSLSGSTDDCGWCARPDENVTEACTGRAVDDGAIAEASERRLAGTAGTAPGFLPSPSHSFDFSPLPPPRPDLRPPSRSWERALGEAVPPFIMRLRRDGVDVEAEPSVAFPLPDTSPESNAVAAPRMAVNSGVEPIAPRERSSALGLFADLYSPASCGAPAVEGPADGGESSALGDERRCLPDPAFSHGLSDREASSVPPKLDATVAAEGRGGREAGGPDEPWWTGIFAPDGGESSEGPFGESAFRLFWLADLRWSAF